MHSNALIPVDCIPLSLEKKSFRSLRYILVAWLTPSPAAFHSRVDMSIEKYSATAELYRKLVVDSCSLSLRAIGYIPDVDNRLLHRVGKMRKARAINCKANNRLDVSRSRRWNSLGTLKLYVRRRIKAIFFTALHRRVQTTKVNTTGADESFYNGVTLSSAENSPPCGFKSRQLFLFALSFP